MSRGGLVAVLRSGASASVPKGPEVFRDSAEVRRCPDRYCFARIRDPQAGLLLETYLQFKEKYVGTPFFPQTLEGFSSMKKILPMNHELIRRALKIQGLTIVFGTDAVAGAHGRNAEDFIDRVRDCGVDPMGAMVSANSLGAAALGMAKQIGAIAPGLEADIIGLDGDPLNNITAVRRVVFVMKGGIVYKNGASANFLIFVTVTLSAQSIKKDGPCAESLARGVVCEAANQQRTVQMSVNELLVTGCDLPGRHEREHAS